MSIDLNRVERATVRNSKLLKKEEQIEDELNATELVECLVEGDVDSVEQYMNSLPLEKQEIKRKKVYDQFKFAIYDVL